MSSLFQYRGGLVFLSAAAFALAFAACDAPPPATTPPVTSVRNEQTVAPSGSRDLKERQMAFLNRIREADPQQRTIDRALLNDQNELGLILDRSVEMDKIPALMRTMLTQMAREFPGEDLTVIAYAPSEPPRKIGTARLDARSRNMTYTPAGGTSYRESHTVPHLYATLAEPLPDSR